MMVRAAVLKMKDPKQIIKDMEKLDEMEFNPVQQPQLNEKVLKDKRKKLRETFERILRLYEKENPDFYKELRKLETEYEQKRSQLCQFFDAVKNAQHVEVESIPLPDMPHAPSNIMIQDIPLPGAQPPSILKKTSAYGPASKPVMLMPPPFHGVPRLPPGKKPPGPPPGPPPPQVLAMYARRLGPPPGMCLRGLDEDNVYDPETAIQDMQQDEEEELSGDEDYPEDMEQGGEEERDDDSEDGKDRDSEDDDEDDFRHRDEDDDSIRKEDDKPGRIVRFADMQDKYRKKKNLKEITPLQAMMLRMAGQEIPEEEEDEEEDGNQEGDDGKMDGDEMKRRGEESRPDGILMPPPTQMPPRGPMQVPPMSGPPPLGPPPAPPLRPPGPPSGLPPGPPPG
uniref:WW domain-binding protein 11-like n=2 Tax=Callorhinchus milii TaxID=7868 RepID=A0A4W3J961_CALMI